MTNRRFVSLVLSIPVVAGLLIGSCVDAASAAEIECTATPELPLGATVQLDSDCSSRLLLNGRKGETVRECATVRIATVAYFTRVQAGKRVPFKGFCSVATAPGSIQYVSVIGG